VSESQRAVLLDFLAQNVSPNVHLNQCETLHRRMDAAAAVEAVYNRVRKGQVIVRKGDPIDAAAATLMAELAGGRDARSQILPLLGTLLLMSSVALVRWLGIRRQPLIDRARATLLGECLLVLLMAVLGTKLCALLASGLGNVFETPPFDDARAYLFALPFAALALVVVALYGRGMALLMSLCYSLLVGLMVEEGTWALPLYAMALSLAAILAVDHFHFRQRAVLLRVGAIVAGVGMGCVLMLAALAGGEPRGALLLQLVCALAGGVLTAGVASFVVPLLESLFSLTTGIKLVELANTNLPLLRRLAFEAPGTFQHSLMVANLTKAGCEDIGADPVLAYTGALYHDIGKMLRPEYFIENQRPGQNRHDKLQPSLSSLILVNHVKDGLELAREHHLPRPLLDAIAEHHGTRHITYFYNKAKEQRPGQGSEVPEESFRYPGPRPRGKVMGVLMLADAVEAAARTLEDPSPVRLRAVIKAITEDCLRDGQLDDTDLTLGDLARIAEAFQRVLAHIHHRRLDYPGFDFNARRQERGVASAAQTAPPAPAGAGREEMGPKAVGGP
jgi:putative nucleotidyltransferase with HDIG domain